MRVWGGPPFSPRDKNASRSHDFAGHSYVIEIPTVTVRDSNQKFKHLRSSFSAEICFSHFLQRGGRHTTRVQLLLSTVAPTTTPTAPTKFSSELEHEERGGEKDTECSNLTTEIMSWLWALWTRQTLELTPLTGSLGGCLQEPSCDVHVIGREFCPINVSIGSWFPVAHCTQMLCWQAVAAPAPSMAPGRLLPHPWSPHPFCKKHSRALGPSKRRAGPHCSPLSCPRAALGPAFLSGFLGLLGEG